MKPRNLVSTVLALALGFSIAGASHGAAIFDPAKQPYGQLPPLVLSGFNVSDGSQSAYQVWFDGYNWAGDLVAYPLSSSGVADASNRLWSAAEWFASKQGCGTATDEPTATTTWYDTGRMVVSKNASGLNKAFRVANFPALGSDLIDYVRGDRSKELENLVVEGGYDPAAPDPSLVQYACGSATGIFRARNSIMGDILHGTPVYVGAPPANYSFEDYQSFKASRALRAPRIYVGANDGMVHAFDAATGAESWAYVPSMVIPNLHKLAFDPYAHTYFVDGGMTAGDVNIGTAASPAWRTVVVGGLGAGGKGLFALDATDPTVFNETFAAAKILWEITPARSGYGDLGDTYGNPIIVRLNTGGWAAIVGNGYNNTNTGRAKLYVINIKDGALIKSFDTGAGSVASPDGLSSPAAIDTNFDGMVDYVYAGDIDGKLWKFDISDANPSNWTDPSGPLYDTGGLSIIGAPDVSAHPISGYLVFFTTGRLFTKADALDNTVVNYAYGIWDGAPAANTTLLNQTLTEKAFGSQRVRVTAGNPVNWNDTSDPSTKPLHYGWRTAMPAGERVLGTGFVRDTRYHFSSVNPTVQNASPPNGENWLNELDFRSGSVGEKMIFDLNSDGLLNDDDRIQSGGNPVAGPSGIPVSIYQGAGLLSQPVVALLSATLSTTIFNDNPFHSPDDQPADPPPILDPGVEGGHFDADLYNAAGKVHHTHEYDDKFNVTGVSFIAPSEPAKAISTQITDPTTQFKILIANQWMSPAVEWSYGGLPYQKVIAMPEYTTTGLSVASLPAFDLNGVGTLRFNMPKDAFKVKDWRGNGDLTVGLMPTKTGCVNSGTTGTIGPAPNLLQKNGALTFQFIKATTPAGKVQLADAAGDPKYGYRIKDAERAAYLLAEYTVFWHHPNGLCFGDAGWVPDPPPDTSAPGKGQDPVPGTQDPPWGDYGTVTNVQVTSEDDPDQSDAKYTIRTTVITFSNGMKAVWTQWMESGTKIIKTVVTVVPPPASVQGLGAGLTQANNATTALTGFKQTRNQGRLGRITWHELFTP